MALTCFKQYTGTCNQFHQNLDLPQIIESMTLTSSDSMINSLDMNQILLGLILDLDFH